VVDKTDSYFQVKGHLGLLPVSAIWSHGYLTADPELLDRADELILGGVALVTSSARTINASLDDPVAAVLTLARCFDQITAATVRLPAGDEVNDPEISLEVLQGHLAQFPFAGGPGAQANLG